MMNNEVPGFEPTFCKLQNLSPPHGQKNIIRNAGVDYYTFFLLLFFLFIINTLNLAINFWNCVKCCQAEE